jgi:hypothetical protein
MSFMVGSNKKQKTSLIRYIIFYVDACNFMEHAHLSHGHIIFKVLVTHWVKVWAKIVGPKSYANA